jgi:SAM-dependent methyltransferase
MARQSAEHTHRALERWRETPIGRYVLSTENTVLADGLEGLYGSFGLQLGDWAGSRLFPRQNDQLHRCYVVASPDVGAKDLVDVWADPHHLPIATESVDVVVLSHLLEQVPHPHPLLREVDRVLISEGRLVIVGFNPYSFWGLRAWLSRSGRAVPWAERLIGEYHLRDWLSLLGYDVTDVRYCLYRPPIAHGGLLARLASLDRWLGRFVPWTGGGYVLVARKRVRNLTPLRRRRRWVPRLVPAGRLGTALPLNTTSESDQ